MNKTLGRLAQPAAYVCVFLLLLCAPNGLLMAQTLRITEPKDATVVNAGQTLTVVVDASPALAFREIVIIAPPPIGFSQILLAPPYRFSMRIPPDTTPRRYHLTADGVTDPGRGATSEPVDILVERSDSPLILTAEPSLMDFQYVGDQALLSAVGKFVNAEWIDLHESTYVRYASDNPRVATVTSDGLVMAAGPGSARITVRYNGKSAVVPVIVRRPQADK